MKIIAIIQARVGSNRLPRKVLLDIQGQTMLERVASRVKRVESLDGVVIATTTNKSDDAIEALCREKMFVCFRGSESNVLKRYCQAALKYRADAVVRITADCPLIDAEIIDGVVVKYLSAYPDVDYASNLMPRTYPRGLDAEVVNSQTLYGIMDKVGDDAFGKEHVTLYIRQHPEEFRVVNVSNDKDYSYLRWTVDTAEDLEFARRVYGHFGDRVFGWRDVLKLLDEHPEWVIRDTAPILEKH